MIALGVATILLVGFARSKGTAVNSLPGVGIPVLDRAVGAATFVFGEQLREGLRDGRPGAVFLVPAVRPAKGRVDLRVVRSIEMKTAVPRRQMYNDAVRIDGRPL